MRQRADSDIGAEQHVAEHRGPGGAKPRQIGGQGRRRRRTGPRTSPCCPTGERTAQSASPAANACMAREARLDAKAQRIDPAADASGHLIGGLISRHVMRQAARVAQQALQHAGAAHRAGAADVIGGATISAPRWVAVTAATRALTHMSALAGSLRNAPPRSRRAPRAARHGRTTALRLLPGCAGRRMLKQRPPRIAVGLAAQLTSSSRIVIGSARDVPSAHGRGRNPKLCRNSTFILASTPPRG